MRIAIATLLAALAAAHAAAQPSLAEVCRDADVPTRAEYASDRTAYADNFCALALYEPRKAARQFDSAIALVRSHNNPNRFYWDPRVEPGAPHIQLLRPWMARQGWRVAKWLGHGGYATTGPFAEYPSDADDVLDVLITAPGAGVRAAITVAIFRYDVSNHWVLFIVGGSGGAEPFGAWLVATASGRGRWRVSLTESETDVDHRYRHRAAALAPRIHRVLDCFENPVFWQGLLAHDCAFHDAGPGPAGPAEADGEAAPKRLRAGATPQSYRERKKARLPILLAE